MPKQSHYVKGIINLRGQIISGIDVCLRFGKQETGFTKRTCIIITRVRGNDFSLIVDEADEVADIRTEQISAPPKIGADSDNVNDYLTRIAQLKMSGNQKERVAQLLRKTHTGGVENKPRTLAQTP